MKGTRWPILPVRAVRVYRQDVVVLRQGQSHRRPVPERGEIKEFSRQSRQRLAFVASNTDVMFTTMLTLTYPREFPNDGKSVKHDLKMFLKELRRKVGKVSVLWFLEFQRRGAPHIHLMLRGVRVYRPMQRWVSETWYRICGTGDERHLRAGTRLERIRNPNGARNYAVKYASKMVQKSVPEAYRNVGRFWGNTKDVKPVLQYEVQCTNDDLVGALEAGKWTWQVGDIVRFKTLYQAADALTKWRDDCILVPSTSQRCHLRMTPHTMEGRGYHEAISNDGRRVRKDNHEGLWYGTRSVAC